MSHVHCPMLLNHDVKVDRRLHVGGHHHRGLQPSPGYQGADRSLIMGEIIAIAAVAANGVIGAENDMYLADSGGLAAVQGRVTTGQVLIMGRKTYDSSPTAARSDDLSVVARDRMWRGDGAQWCAFSG